ncbi:MAG TPA: YkvA family protein [Bradyrhizobium sp.]
MFHDIKLWARRLIRDVHAVYLAAYDPRVPWYAKILAAAVAGYALSPIDLIPDFIPVLGYADDLIIVPLGIWLVVSLIPNEVMAECRAKADAAEQRPRSTTAAVAIIAIWVGAAAMLGWAGFTRWHPSG